MIKHRYEFIGGTSKKFWEIEEPQRIGTSSSWVVRVHFGRIGTAGQNHLNAFWDEKRATQHFDKKRDEKLGKGYKYVSYINDDPNTKTKQTISSENLQPYQVPQTLTDGLVAAWDLPKKNPAYPKPQPKACDHLQLRKTGERKWECNSCKTNIEFDKPQQTMTAEVEVATVRRFIDLSALRG